MGVKVRRAAARDAEGIARVQVDTWRTAYRGIVPEEYLSSLSYERSRGHWETEAKDSSRQALFVAEDDDGKIVGLAASGPAREMKDSFSGELYAIYVLREMQGRGVGRRLVLAAATDLAARGFGSMLVWVLADNPYRRFYVSLGGEPVATKDAVVGGRSLRESGFGWRNIASLIERLTRVAGTDSG